MFGASIFLIDFIIVIIILLSVPCITVIKVLPFFATFVLNVFEGVKLHEKFSMRIIICINFSWNFLGVAYALPTNYLDRARRCYIYSVAGQTKFWHCYKAVCVWLFSTVHYTTQYYQHKIYCILLCLAYLLNFRLVLRTCTIRGCV